MNGQFQYLISLAFDYSKIAESENQCYLYFIIHVLRKLSTFELKGTSIFAIMGRLLLVAHLACLINASSASDFCRLSFWAERLFFTSPVCKKHNILDFLNVWKLLFMLKIHIKYNPHYIFYQR